MQQPTFGAALAAVQQANCSAARAPYFVSLPAHPASFLPCAHPDLQLVRLSAVAHQHQQSGCAATSTHLL